MKKEQIILLGVVVALAGYLSWDLWSERKTTENEQATKQIVKFKESQVQLFQLIKATETIELKRSVEGWSLSQPLEDAADNIEVESFLSAAVNDRIVDVVVEGADVDWKTYGLDDPAVKVRFVNNLNEEAEILVSEKTNFEGHVYARIKGQDKVVTVSANWLNRGKKGPLDFRDRRVLRKKMASVDEVLVENKVGALKIGNKEGQWIFTEDPNTQLDQAIVRETMQSLVDAKFMDFLNEQEIARLATSKPVVKVGLRFPDHQWSLEAYQVVDSQLWAKISEPAYFVRLEVGSLGRWISLQGDQLRDKTLPFKFAKEQVSEIRFETRLKKLKLKKDLGLWQLVDGQAGLIVQSEKVNLMLNNIVQSKATSYLKKAPAADKLKNRLVFLDQQGQTLMEIRWQELAAGQFFEASSSLYAEAFQWSSTEMEKLYLNDLAVFPASAEQKTEPPQEEEIEGN